MSRCDNPARVQRAERMQWRVRPAALRRCTRRYSSQRDEFHQLAKGEGREGPAADYFRGSGLRDSRRCERWEPWRCMTGIAPPRRNTAAPMANPQPPGLIYLHCSHRTHFRQNLLRPVLPQFPRSPHFLVGAGEEVHWKQGSRSANPFATQSLPERAPACVRKDLFPRGSPGKKNSYMCQK